jgi:ribonuclease D
MRVAWLLVALGLGTVAAQNGASHEEVVKGMLTTLDKLAQTLKTVQDRETATAAVPELRKEAAAWQQLRKKAKELPPPDRPEKDRLAKEYRAKLDEARTRLLTEVARVQLVPGGLTALQELRPVLTKPDE